MTPGNGYAPERGNNSNWSSNAPVFSIDFEGDSLPVIWITEQSEKPTLEKTGRNCWHRYPGALSVPGMFVRDEAAVSHAGANGQDGEADEAFEIFSQIWEARESDTDEEGWQALSYGSAYYREGMDTQDAAFKQDRIDCFRAAEVLYLWAASKGNAQGFVNLGYVYSYDRCEGDYLGMDERGERICEPGEFPRERRAYECFAKAAQAGHPEACYKLGDLVSWGRGCDVDLVEAVELWKKAFEGSRACDEPTWWGAAALRLGSAYENGDGCEQSFERALSWYTYAQTGLRITVDAGDWYYEKSLARAEAGVARCRQELG